MAGAYFLNPMVIKFFQKETGKEIFTYLELPLIYSRRVNEGQEREAREAKRIADERIRQFTGVITRLTRADWNVTNLTELGALKCISDQLMSPSPKILFTELDNLKEHEETLTMVGELIKKWRDMKAFQEETEVKNAHLHMTNTDKWYCRCCMVAGKTAEQKKAHEKSPHHVAQTEARPYIKDSIVFFEGKVLMELMRTPVCPNCKKTFNLVESLENHMQTCLDKCNSQLVTRVPKHLKKNQKRLTEVISQKIRAGFARWEPEARNKMVAAKALEELLIQTRPIGPSSKVKIQSIDERV